jgi:hypothetical protein
MSLAWSLGYVARTVTVGLHVYQLTVLSAHFPEWCVCVCVCIYIYVYI